MARRGVTTISPGSMLSDLGVCRIEINNVVYPTVDHYVQLELLRAFGLLAPAKQLATVVDPQEFRHQLEEVLSKARNDGTLPFHLIKSWVANNTRRLLKKANHNKFTQNFDLKKELLDSGDDLLVYTSRNNRVTGIGMTEDEFQRWEKDNSINAEEILVFIAEVTEDISTMLQKVSTSVVGANLLGVTLMEVRAELKGEIFSLPLLPPPAARKFRGLNETDNSTGLSFDKTPIISSTVVVPSKPDKTASQRRIEALLRKVVQRGSATKKTSESKSKRLERPRYDPNVPSTSAPTAQLKSVSILKDQRRILYSTTIPSMAQHRRDAMKQRMVEAKLNRLKTQRFMAIDMEVKILLNQMVTVVSDSLDMDAVSGPEKESSFSSQLSALAKLRLLSVQKSNFTIQSGTSYTEQIREYPARRSTVISIDDITDDPSDDWTPPATESRKLSLITGRSKQYQRILNPNFAFRRHQAMLEEGNFPTVTVDHPQFIGPVPSSASGFTQALQKRQRNLNLRRGGGFLHPTVTEQNPVVPPFFINPLCTTDNDVVLPAGLQPKRIPMPPWNQTDLDGTTTERTNPEEIVDLEKVNQNEMITPAPFILNLSPDALRDLLRQYNFKLKEIDGKLGEANVDFINGELIRYNGKIVQVFTQLPPRPIPHTKQIGKPSVPPAPPQWALRLVTRKRKKRKKKTDDADDKPIIFEHIKAAMQYQAERWVKGGGLDSTGKYDPHLPHCEASADDDDIIFCAHTEETNLTGAEQSETTAKAADSAQSGSKSAPKDLLTISNSIRSLADFYSDAIIKKSSRLIKVKSEPHTDHEHFHQRNHLEPNWKDILIKQEPPTFLEETKYPLEWYSLPESVRMLRSAQTEHDWRKEFRAEVWYQDTSGFRDWLTMVDFADEPADEPSSIDSTEMQSMRLWFKQYKSVMDVRMAVERQEKKEAEEAKIAEVMVNVKVEPEDDYEDVSYVGSHEYQPEETPAESEPPKKRKRKVPQGYYRRPKPAVISMSDGTSGVSSDGGVSLFSRAVHYDEFLQNLRHKGTASPTFRPNKS